MTQYKRKKDTKQRGLSSHGYGSKKKHRGAGSRGGRGMAGTGKKGDVKKPCIWKIKKYFGRHGMTSLKGVLKCINFSDINQKLEKIGEKKKEGYFIDLTQLGYDKLLSCGTPQKYEINVGFASKKAIDKMKTAGGKLTLPVVSSESVKDDVVSPEAAKEE